MPLALKTLTSLSPAAYILRRDKSLWKKEAERDCSSGLLETLTGPYNAIVTKKRLSQVGA